MSMTPEEVKSTMPTRWSYLSKVINNKKAIDIAFMKHQWEMQKSAADNASTGSKEKIAMTLAQKALADGDIRPDDPNYQQEFYKAYTYFLNPTSPTSTISPQPDPAAAMATGGAPSQPTDMQPVEGGQSISRSVGGVLRRGAGPLAVMPGGYVYEGVKAGAGAVGRSIGEFAGGFTEETKKPVSASKPTTPGITTKSTKAPKRPKGAAYYSASTGKYYDSQGNEVK